MRARPTADNALPTAQGETGGAGSKMPVPARMQGRSVRLPVGHVLLLNAFPVTLVCWALRTNRSGAVPFVAMSAFGGKRRCRAATGSGDRRAWWNESVRKDMREQAMPARVEAVWAASGAFAVALFVCGLLFGDLLATTNFPALNATPSRLREYFLRNVSEVRALSFFHLLAAAALAAFASYLYARLRSAGIRVATLALTGGIIAAAFLAMSALCYRVLAEHSVASDPALAHALVVLSYLAGGPAIGVPLALTAGAFAAAIRRERILPGWLYWLSIAAVVLGVASATTMLGPTNNGSVVYGVLLLAAVLLFAWLVASSLVLVTRARRPG